MYKLNPNFVLCVLICFGIGYLVNGFRGAIYGAVIMGVFSIVVSLLLDIFDNPKNRRRF